MYREKSEKRALLTLDAILQNNSDVNLIFVNSSFGHIKVVFLNIPTVRTITSFSTRYIILPYRCVYDAPKQGRVMKALASPNSLVSNTSPFRLSRPLLLLQSQLWSLLILQFMLQTFRTACNSWNNAYCLWLHASGHPIPSFWNLLLVACPYHKLLITC